MRRSCYVDRFKVIGTPRIDAAFAKDLEGIVAKHKEAVTCRTAN
ncbi:MAG: hypothetical protein JWO13_1191 [Acidobacteriales bacterium]|nr:hypothetical protein [Terriglobales bacterium]